MGIGSGVLALDTVLSATFHFTTKWSNNLQSNKARDLLRYVVCRLYDEGRGQLMNAHLSLAQTTLAHKLGISRQWVGELVNRLDREGWIEHQAPKLPDGTNGSTMFRAGRMLKRLVVTLLKSKQQKTPIIKPAKSSWHFSPLKREKELLSILQREKAPPRPALLERIPLLKVWLQRGKEEIEGRGKASLIQKISEKQT
jgi:Mn-dependent DtxR family transcriptional regulator